MATTNSSTSASTGKNKSQFVELMRQYNAGAYFPFRLEFCHVLTHEEAIFVQRLVNLYNMIHESDVDEDGFFRCSVSFLNYPPLSWTTEEQRYLLDDLTTEERPYLSKKIVGNSPRQRWLRVNIVKIHEDIENERRGLGRAYRKNWNKK